jgi:D-amino peptidase
VKIYISADMEGVAGVVTDAQLGPEGFAWKEACGLYTDEVLAVIDELQSAGATDITVSDSHGTGLNLKIERLPAGVRLVQSWPRRLGMMEGIDDSFDGVILLGYHSGSHNPRGVRAHTMSSANIFEVALNGTLVCEAELSAYIAAHFKVPILMLSGDDAVCAEIATGLPDCEQAIVKRALSYHSADSLTPADACDVLRAATRRALERRSTIQARALQGAVTMDITFKNHRPTELLAYLPSVEQLDAHRVRFVGKDILEVSSFFEFALNYSPDLKP